MRRVGLAEVAVTHRAQRAFSILEIVLALAIVAILLLAAVPSYRGYVLRAERAEAIRRLLAAATCQERTAARLGHYDTTKCGEEPDGKAYAIRFDPPDETDARAFTVTATPRHKAANDRCGSLSIDQAGTRSIEGTASKLQDCWGGR